MKPSKNILVTGAAGFAGGIVARCLQDAGFHVTGTIHQHEADGTFPTVRCDLAEPWTLDGTFDAIVHTAGALPYQQPSVLAYKKSNVDAMQHLVAFAKTHGVRRVIFFSAQSFFLWDNPSPTHQRRLMSMSFKKKYSSSG